MTVKLKNQFSGLPFWAGIALISLLQCQQKEGKKLEKGMDDIYPWKKDWFGLGANSVVPSRACIFENAKIRISS